MARRLRKRHLKTGTGKRVALDRNAAVVRIYLRGIMLSLSIIFFMDLMHSSSEASEFSIKPSVTLRQEYDDNIYLSHSDRTSDVITRVLPSLNMRYNAPFWEWTFDYTLNWWYYWKLKDSENSHYANLASKMKIIQNFLYFDVSDKYESVILNPRKPSTESNLSVNRSDSNYLIASPYMKYQIDPSFFLSAGYRYSNIWYREESGNKSQAHTGFAGVEYLISPLLTVRLGTAYTAFRPEQTDSDNDQGFDQNNDQIKAFIGASYKISPQMTFDGSLGQTWISFDGGEDTNRAVYNIGLTYGLSENGQIEMRAISVIEPSPEEGMINNRSETITVRYGQAVAVSGSIYHRYNKYLESGKVDKIYGGAADIQYRPDQRITFRVSGGYEKDKYLPANNKRTIYSGGGGVAYLLTAKSTLGITYNYTDSSGDNEDDNYRDNFIGLELKMNL
jgi:opacity protein-like surface antigen